SEKMIYLDNAATTVQKPSCVAEAVVNAMGNLGVDASAISIVAPRSKTASSGRTTSPGWAFWIASASEPAPVDAFDVK
ncbi:MAG: hypothetical protein IJ991_11585, partial [Thermoguttaceae bacterium]|nr:hypothetical protein [Thermoguttaceae bacterium]